MKIIGTTRKYKGIIVQSNFCIKLLFYDYHKNLNPILT
ncbi:hypothetical protein LEP1GSC037_3663 [Leptospira interrogans str. 2006001854]|uniref:Uncharacterized protein n=1 Tax=Leptospira interrogans str. 2006001854 TaxID=1001590 RepID=M6GLB4_LEPIR|nr:hypothetical protein LEP1GSC037_3663 [Leptospira interrogans str. 2006001854]